MTFWTTPSKNTASFLIEDSTYQLRVLISLRSNDYCITGSYYMITIWLLYDNYVIHIPCLSLCYRSVTLLSGNGVVSGITSMIYTLSCILYVLSENTFSVPSKSSQESILTSFLPENQDTIFTTQYVGFVVIVGLKPSKPTIPTHVVFIFRVKVSAVFRIHLSVFRFTKERLNTSIDTSKKNNYIKKLTPQIKWLAG